MFGLFVRAGLKTNVGKTFGMVFRPCQAAGHQQEAAYGRKMTGEGPSYWERQRGRIQCKECGEDMAIRLMAGHMPTQHEREVKGRRCWGAKTPGEEPQKYRMASLTAGGLRNCPVEG